MAVGEPYSVDELAARTGRLDAGPARRAWERSKWRDASRGWRAAVSSGLTDLLPI